MTIRVYRWDDASAPTLAAGTTGSLITVLDAVLVNGYGSKTAAGWTKAFSGTNLAAYQNTAGTGRYFRVDHSTSSVNYARVRAYKTMSDVNTGTIQTPTDAQLSGGLYFWLSSTTDTTARPWLIVADGKSFHMWVGYSVTTATGLATTAAMQHYFVGDRVPYKGDDVSHFMLTGNYTAAATSNHTDYAPGSLGNTQNGVYTIGTYSNTDASTATVFIIDANYGTSAMSQFGASGGVTYPDPVTGGMLMCKVRSGEAPGIMRGVIPGLWCPMHQLPGNPGDTFSGTEDLAGRTFILLDGNAGGTRCRFILETSDTWYS